MIRIEPVEYLFCSLLSIGIIASKSPHMAILGCSRRINSLQRVSTSLRSSSENVGVMTWKSIWEGISAQTQHNTCMCPIRLRKESGRKRKDQRVFFENAKIIDK